MNKKEKEIWNQLEREAEDKAWAEKKSIYGDKFNAMKHYEMTDPWINFKAWLPFLIMIGVALWICVPKVFKHIKDHDKMLSEWKQSHSL